MCYLFLGVRCGFPLKRNTISLQKRSCVHIENFDKNENMVNLGHKIE
jgi:hypothetical protein